MIEDFNTQEMSVQRCRELYSNMAKIAESKERIRCMKLLERKG